MKGPFSAAVSESKPGTKMASGHLSKTKPLSRYTFRDQKVGLLVKITLDTSDFVVSPYPHQYLCFLEYYKMMQHKNHGETIFVFNGKLVSFSFSFVTDYIICMCRLPTRRVGQILCEVPLPIFYPYSLRVCCWNSCIWSV